MVSFSTNANNKAEKLDKSVTAVSNDAASFASTLKNDVNALKEDAIELGRHVRDNNGQMIKEVKEVASRQLDKAKTYGAEELKKTEAMIREKPAKSVAIAFAAGLIASFLFGRR